jgi:uncharacterized protein YdbL (DUF1318 family)
MKLLKWLTSSLSGLMLVSCVTINIYFPAAAAEKAADKIIEDVWGPVAPDAQPESEETTPKPKADPVAIQLLNWFTSPAYAAGANLNISTPAINGLQSKMKQRHNALKPFYTSGAIGLTNNGLLAVRDAKAIPLKDRNKVKGLVADENKDRNALYTEIARANGHPEWQADIQATFAKRWVEKAAKGWWYNSGSGWKQK